jgi:hypothetical protein
LKSQNFLLLLEGSHRDGVCEDCVTQLAENAISKAIYARIVRSEAADS